MLKVDLVLRHTNNRFRCVACVICNTKSPNVRLMVEGVGSVSVSTTSLCVLKVLRIKGRVDNLRYIKLNKFNVMTLTFNESDTAAWKVELKVNRRLLTFKIDTGADFSIMDESTYHSLRPKPRLNSVTN